MNNLLIFFVLIHRLTQTPYRYAEFGHANNNFKWVQITHICLIWDQSF